MTDRINEIEEKLQSYGMCKSELSVGSRLEMRESIRYLVAEVKKLRCDLVEWQNSPPMRLMKHKHRIEELEAENARLRDVLEFYADCHLDEGKR